MGSLLFFSLRVLYPISRRLLSTTFECSPPHWIRLKYANW
jgi:hypothetical protein